MGKLVEGGHGGYYFEHNLFLRHALVSLGFWVTSLTARGRWKISDEVFTPRGRMLIGAQVMRAARAWYNTPRPAYPRRVPMMPRMLLPFGLPAA